MKRLRKNATFIKWSGVKEESAQVRTEPQGSSHSAMFLCSSQEMTQGLYFLLLSKFKRYLGRGTNNIIELIDYSLCFSLLTIQVASFSIATNYFLYSHKKYIQFRLRLTDTVASVCV